MPVKHGLRFTRIYRIWRSMKTRCENPKSQSYKNYGGRGIKILWPDFMAFHSDMIGSYFPEGTIERKDVDKNYCKENCIWIPKSEQNNNKRNTVFITIHGKKIPLAEAAKKYGIGYHTLYGRIHTYGLTPEQAVSAKSFLHGATKAKDFLVDVLQLKI